jgi:predicted RNA-binding protein associated with RNAse of E/G family
LTHFRRGERIVIREVLNDKVWTVRPVTVQEDSDTQVVTWLASGTLIEYPVGVEHGRTCISMWLSGQWDLYEKEFFPPGVLRIAPRDAPYEVFAPMVDGEVQRWYVNFQQPLRRTPLGFDTMDEILDLVVSLDCRSWERKDADEVELALDMGFLSEGDAQRIEDNCRAVEVSLARGVVPWDRSWATWRADT